jgi:hypothetical protein
LISLRYFFDPLGCFKGLFSKNSNVHRIPSNGNPIADHFYHSDNYQRVLTEFARDFKEMFGG